jgi:hypothetical protein
MRLRLLVLTFLLGLGSLFSVAQTTFAQTQSKSPLGSYIDVLRKQTVDSHVVEFARVCAVKPQDTRPRYAFANDDAGTWKAVKSLPTAYDNLEMDLLSTAEVWRTSQGTLVELWNAALDVGGFGRTLYCFDGTGKLLAIDSANYQIPEEGAPWGMHEQWIRQANGHFKATIPLEFIQLDDRRIVKPKLDDDSAKFAASWGRKSPEAFSVRELKLPTLLFQ